MCTVHAQKDLIVLQTMISVPTFQDFSNYILHLNEAQFVDTITACILTNYSYRAPYTKGIILSTITGYYCGKGTLNQPEMLF